MLHSSQVPLNQSALLVIDVQDSFKAGERWSRRNNPRFEANVAALIDAYRAADLPVIFVLHTDDDDGFALDSPYFKLMDFLAPRPDEPVIIKETRNCFTGTNLQSLLLGRGVRRLAITGIQMEQCCETTTRVAADLGYAVDFVVDATLTFPIPNWDVPGEELGVAEIEERTVYALRRRFARIVSSAELAGELAATQAEPALA
ncbi:MAG TPA: cysteine hydrolase family protein [Herpetosiphonaceae bacterium]|nr:cysteine hydrolase family protein [Herpetosiphonaceae bacterium]